MFKRKQEPAARKRGSGGEDDQRFYEYIAAPLGVWHWNKTVSPEMNKLAMRDLLAAVSRAKELFPYPSWIFVKQTASIFLKKPG